LEIPNYITG